MPGRTGRSTLDPPGTPWRGWSTAALTREKGRLHFDGQGLDELAERWGTPLHVVSAETIRRRCREFAAALRPYPGPVRTHFSYKTNPVAGVLRVLHAEGLGAEVVSGYELWLALKLGVRGEAIVFNGPNKSDLELRAALEARVGLVVVDGLGELQRLAALAAEAGAVTPVALRVCPDVRARGMNPSSASGSRRSQFGLDLRSGEAGEAVRRATAERWLRLRGIHVHVGSGIHDLRAFEVAAGKAVSILSEAVRAGAEAPLLDLGGGLGALHSREFTGPQMLRYLLTGRLPREAPEEREDLFARYGAALARAVERACRRYGMAIPELVLEPGRALVSDAQVLLLTVGEIRDRPGVGAFAFADGGAMTVSLQFLSERHRVLLANREAAPVGTTSVFGRLPSPMDVVYRNLPLPRLRRGDILAVLDAGAYFVSTATNFGGPRPPVLLLDQGRVLEVRRRETFEDLAQLDLQLTEGPTATAGPSPSSARAS